MQSMEKCEPLPADVTSAVDLYNQDMPSLLEKVMPLRMRQVSFITLLHSMMTKTVFDKRSGKYSDWRDIGR